MVTVRLSHLTLTIIIVTIFEICQPIIDIAHSETFEDPLDFQGDSTFFNFDETQAWRNSNIANSALANTPM